MTEVKQRFNYIDQFRGFIGILMLLGHCSYYFNSIWKQLDPFDPLFPTWGQFFLRYAGYLCAPGFLMMAGAMVYLSYTRSVDKGTSKRKALWYFIQRGLFLILVQLTWVNSSWGGFQTFNPFHIGIISTIGFSMIFLTLFITLRWQFRLIIAIALLLIHAYLLTITFSFESAYSQAILELFIQSGSYNKYPVMPWLGFAILGSVMSNAWFFLWKSDRKRIFYTISIALGALFMALAVRISGGFGNIFPYSEFGTISFFVDQKYPPTLFHNLWFFGFVLLGVASFIVLNRFIPKITTLFSIPGKVPLFFYGMHLAILGVAIKRFDFFYREGGIWTTFIGFAIMLAIMLPLSHWFYGIKKKSKNFLIRMI